jgi:sortase B
MDIETWHKRGLDMNRGRDFIGSKIYMGICFGVIIICCGILFHNHLQKTKQNAEIKELATEVVTVEKSDEEDTDIIHVDFNSLKKVNEDICAWISVPGTNINYPVLQSKENQDTDYYLNTNLDGSQGYPGSIYIQLRNSRDFTDSVTVMYGHNMKNKSMFATLHNYTDGEFFQENPYIYVYTPDENIVYKVFAAVVYDDKLILDYYDDFRDLDDLEIFIDDVESSKGNFDREVEISKKDKILGLSTCMSNSPDERYYVWGVKMTDEEKANISDKYKQKAANAIFGGVTELISEEE